MKRTVMEIIAISAFLFPLIYLIMMPRTSYAPAFSEKNFSQIKIGMSAGEVVALIGNPFAYSDGGYWGYSHPGHSPLIWSHWNERGLILSGGVVVEIIRSYRYYED
jgi:hypothetical protein